MIAKSIKKEAKVQSEAYFKEQERKTNSNLSISSEIIYSLPCLEGKFILDILCREEFVLGENWVEENLVRPLALCVCISSLNSPPFGHLGRFLSPYQIRMHPRFDRQPPYFF